MGEEKPLIAQGDAAPGLDRSSVLIIHRTDDMEADPASLKRLKAFLTFICDAKRENLPVSFHRTPTEHGDNITAMVTTDGERRQAGIVFWDVAWLQEQGLLDVLDDDELALGMTLTDSLVEDAARILAVVETELAKQGF